MAKTRFDIRGISLRGEWDSEDRVLLVRDLGGEVTVKGNMLGRDFDITGEVEGTMENCLHFHVKSIGRVPPFFHEMILKWFAKFNRRWAGAVSETRDTLVIDPNRLVPENSDIRVFIEPTDFELADGMETTWRQKVLDWTQRNAGELAKDVVDYVLSIPDMLGLLKRLALDTRISRKVKAKIALYIAYVLSPVDLIPEILAGPLGLVDDTYVLLKLIRELATEIPEALIREHWRGRPEVLEVLIKGQAMARVATTLPNGVLKRLMRIFG